MYYEELLDAESSLETTEEMEQYHILLKNQVKDVLELAYQAREKKMDPEQEVEIYIAQDVASRTEGLVGPEGVGKRFKELEASDVEKDQIVVKIAKEIAQGKFGDDSPEDLADQALRTALSYQTEGITAAPIEGIDKVSIKTNPDGTQYLAVYYAGPIRSAGGTAQGVSVYIADLIRQELGLDRYKATEPEIERMLEEVRMYNDIMNLQLPTSDDEIRHAWKNLPIMVHGDPTESEEVSGYRNLDSMETNRVRGGACLVLNDGLVGRAKKIMKRVKKLGIEGWDWLDEIASGKFTDKRATETDDDEDKKEVKPDVSFASDALMGRPTFADATTHGGWRLRYGHARNTGIAGIGIHPGLMSIVNDFLAPGTHVRTERPGKGSIVTPIDTIRPPMVILKNGDVLEVESYDHGKEIRNQIEEILFVGDMLIGYGEFIQNNYHLCPPGYCEEWWYQEMKEAGWEKSPEMGKEIQFYADLNYNPPTVQEAIELAKEYNVPLHPKYTPAWKYLDIDEVKKLQETLWNNKSDTYLPIEIKPILETLFIPHQVKDDKIDIGDYLPALQEQLPKQSDIQTDESSDSLTIVQNISQVKIRDSMGTTIGARMGRPEKAKGRRMTPQLNGLFPVGDEKGVRRILGKAMERPNVSVRLSNRYCSSCNIGQWHTYCRDCDQRTELIGECRRCGSRQEEGPCDNCGSRVDFTTYYDISLVEHLDDTYKRLGQLEASQVKLKDQIESPTGTPELIDKGILRARHDLHVFRDGTVRYDATDAPLTHFYPYEIGVSVDKLRELGYTHDAFGNKLTTDDQLVEIKPQDIIIHQSAIRHFTNVANFVDDELTSIYDMDPYYNISDKKDLVGHLVIGLAPHTSAGVIGRIIGFTRSSVCWAHPFWHASKRRNCDGDEDGIILLMDGFLNFSKKYLPTKRGSKMDTPLVLVVTLNPAEVDDEAFNLDCVTHYPLEFYQAANEMKKPFAVKDQIEIAEDRLDKPEQYEGFVFSHHTRDISEGPLMTRYKDGELNIRDKLDEQLYLAEIIHPVNEQNTALRILEKHALPDLLGNLRAFGSQKVRCVTCNSKYRRIPLRGKCMNDNCSRSNLVLTVPPKGVTKYYDVCEDLIQNYNLGQYHEDRLEKIRIAIESHFNESGPVQLDLSEWM